jgi:glycosyltransferase involved in cell wall biosynthesis
MNARVEPLRELPDGAADKAVSAPPRPVRLLEVMGNAIVGGMETYVARLVEGLPRAGFAITVLCPCESRITERLRTAGAEVLVTPMPHDEAPWLSVHMACALVKANGIDVLHAHLPNAHLLAGLAGSLTHRPVVTTIHGRQVTPLDVEVHHSAGTHVSVVCRHSYYHALGMGIRESQLSCIPNGVDTGLFQPRDGRIDVPGGLRESLGIEAGTPLVGFVGRLSPEKGPEVFLNAMARLHRLVPQACAVLVGDGPMRQELERLAAAMAPPGAVKFAGVREDMAAVYRALDVLVSSSHSEAMPLCVMEAMASGVPVVATRVGGVPELIEQGQTGFGVGARDADGLAGQVALLLRQPEQRLRMGQRARERALRHFSLDACVAHTAELLAQLASQPVVSSPVAGLRMAPRRHGM